MKPGCQDGGVNGTSKSESTMTYWLMKTEPDVFSIEDLKNSPDKTSMWEGVRNYQARNFMREMKVGERVFIYHSSCKVPGIAGLARISREAYPDPFALDRDSAYFDVKSSVENNRWSCVDVTWEQTLPEVISLQQLKQDNALEGMSLLARNRLSVMPVTTTHWEHILHKYFSAG